MSDEGREPLLDTAWAGRAFLVPASSLSDKTDDNRRYFTSSSRKFVSAAIGGHHVLNPIPQMTANCDIPHEAFFTQGLDTPSRWWSEVMDDNQQVIHFRPGVPKYNSLTTFFGNFYNVEMGAIARTGKGLGIGYALGRVLGTIGTLPLQPFILGSAMVKFFLQMPRSKYYYLQPTSHPYRFTVQTMLNAIMTNEGLIVGDMGGNDRDFIHADLHPDDVDMSSLKRSYHGVLDKYGYMNKAGAIDVYAIATSAARLASDFKKSVEAMMEQRTSGLTLDTFEQANAARESHINYILSKGIENSLKELTIRPMTLYRRSGDTPNPDGSNLEDAYMAAMGRAENLDDVNQPALMLDELPEDMEDAGMVEKASAFIAATWEHFKKEAEYGTDYVSFRCNWTGSQSESFNNQTGESSLASSINSTSSRAREIRFSTMDGNAIGGPIGAVIGMAMDTVKQVATGILDSAKLSGAIALAGNAFADIQKMYQSSSADLNRTTFTIHLRSWSADPFVRLQNIWFPLVHLMVLALPRATGPGSYDGPYLLECINRGKTIIREGMIESISIERGVGDIGFGRNYEALGIDVNVTVVDMSSIMSIPINAGAGTLATVSASIAGVGVNLVDGAGSKLGLTSGTIDGMDVADTAMAALHKRTYSEDNKYTDYLATITGLPLDSVINPKRKWKMNMARMKADMSSSRTAANLGSGLFSGMPGDLFKFLFSEGTSKY